MSEFLRKHEVELVRESAVDALTKMAYSHSGNVSQQFNFLLIYQTLIKSFDPCAVQPSEASLVLRHIVVVHGKSSLS